MLIFSTEPPNLADPESFSAVAVATEIDESANRWYPIVLWWSAMRGWTHSRRDFTRHKGGIMLRRGGGAYAD